MTIEVNLNLLGLDDLERLSQILSESADYSVNNDDMMAHFEALQIIDDYISER